MNDNQMLTTFSEEFVKFRESFHNTMNGVMDFEMTNGLYETQEKSSKRLVELDALIAEKQKEINDNKNLPTEEYQALETRNNEMIRGYNQEKDVIENDRKDLEKQYDEKIKDFRDKFKKNIDEMKQSLGFHVVKGKDISMIDVLKNNMESKITMISYQLATLHAELNTAKTNEDRKHIAEQMQTLAAERKKLEELVENLDKFIDLLNKLERHYIKGNDYINAFDLDRYSKTFEEIADVVVDNVDNTLISVNIITNEDGSYSLDMRCGNKICEPRPLIPADRFNKATVDQYLNGFASILAAKTDLKYDDLIASKVILKTDGVDLGRHEFKTVGEMSEKVKEGKRDEVLAAAGVTPDNSNQQTGPDNGNGQQGPDNNNQQQGLDNGNGQQGPDNNNQQQGLDNGNGQQGLDNGNGQQGPDNGNDPLNLDDDLNNVNNQQGPQTPVIDDHVMKVVDKRNARSSKFSAAKTAALIAAGGLGLAGMSGLAVAAGLAGGLVAACEVGIKGIDRIKYRCMRRKLKNVAKKMSEETELDIKYYENMETRQAGFVLGDSKDILTEEKLSALAASELGEGVDDQILDIFNNTFEKVNKYRGKGASARTIKEYDYRNFPQITFDNVTAAFEEWGGLRTRKELKEHKFDVRNIFKSRKKAQEQEELANEENGVGEVDPEELENALNEGSLNVDNPQQLGDGSQLGQQQNVDPQIQQQGQQNVDPQTQQQGQQNVNPQTQQQGQQNVNSQTQQQGQQNVNPQTQQQGQQNVNSQTQQQGQQNVNPQTQQGGAIGQNDSQAQQGSNDQQNSQGPVVVNPLAPSAQEPAVMEMMFPQAEQQAKKDDVVLSMRDKIQDPTNSIEVADLLTKHLRAYKDELSEQSKIDLVNLFHEEVKFTEGQMEKFDFICRNDRTLTDFEAKETIDRFERIRSSKGEGEVGMAISQFINENKGQLTKEDIEALQKFDTKGDFITDAITAEMFNGRTL